MRRQPKRDPPSLRNHTACNRNSVSVRVPETLLPTSQRYVFGSTLLLTLLYHVKPTFRLCDKPLPPTQITSTTNNDEQLRGYLSATINA